MSRIPARSRASPRVPPRSRASPREAQTWQLLRVARRLRARERHELVDFLHDGPIQELTAVTLELQMMCRSVPPAPRLDAVLHRLSSAAGSLRWLVDGPWPFLEPEVRLAAALQQRTAWLLAALDELASALGASMHARLRGRRWRARIGLPRQPAPVH